MNKVLSKNKLRQIYGGGSPSLQDCSGSNNNALKANANCASRTKRTKTP